MMYVRERDPFRTIGRVHHQVRAGPPTLVVAASHRVSAAPARCWCGHGIAERVRWVVQPEQQTATCCL
jgi:hypothetical protein